MQRLILVINYGSTSTKVAAFRGMEEVARRSYTHTREELYACPAYLDQLPLRRAVVEDFLSGNGLEEQDIACIVPRYGLVARTDRGTIRVDADFIRMARTRPDISHALYLCPITAWELFDGRVPIYISDYQHSYGIWPLLRVSGVPELEWDNLCHTENHMAVSRKAAAELGKPIEETSLVVGHLGGGVSYSWIAGGVIRGALGDGEASFAPERSGVLPAQRLVDLCYSGKYTHEQAMRFIKSHGGVYAHLGTSDCIDVENRAIAGEEQAAAVYSALGVRMAESLARVACFAKGKVDAVVLTGGLSRSGYLVGIIKEHTAFIAPMLIYPGEYEMQYFARVGQDVLDGKAAPVKYVPA